MGFNSAFKGLKIAAWNANGLSQHVQEIKLFLQTFNLDIPFVSEIHFINRSYITIPKCNMYYTNHPDETAHGGTAVIVIQH
jgi:exonuclease III